MINFLPALRVGDQGVHTGCCGPNTWTATEGSPTVFINGKPAHRLGDAGKHCGGAGKLIEGSPDVIIGNAGVGAASRRLAVPLLPVAASRMPAINPLMAGMVFVNVDPSLVRKAIEIAKNPKGALGTVLKAGVDLGLDRLGERLLHEVYHTVEAAWKVLREVPFIGDYLKLVESYANNFLDTLSYYWTEQVPAFDYAPPGSCSSPEQLPCSDYILLDDGMGGGLWRWPGVDVTYPLYWLLEEFAPIVWSFEDDAPPVSILDLDDPVRGHGHKADNGNLDIDDDYARDPARQSDRGPYLSAWKISDKLIQIEVGFLRASSFHPCSRPDDPLNYEHESDGERAYLYLQIDKVSQPTEHPGVVVGKGRIISIVGTGHGKGGSRIYGSDKLNFRGKRPEITIARGSHATGITTGLLPTGPGIRKIFLDYYAGPGVEGVRCSSAYQIADRHEAEALYVKYAGYRYGNHAVVSDCYPCWEPGPKEDVSKPDLQPELPLEATDLPNPYPKPDPEPSPIKICVFTLPPPMFQRVDKDKNIFRYLG